MNTPIRRLFVATALLFGVLVAFTSRWTVFESDKLRANTYNRRALLAEEKIKRGTIRAADGTVLARSVSVGSDRFRREYPTDSLFSQVIGYSFTDLGRAGLERSRNDQITGKQTEMLSVVDSLIGRDRVGKDIQTTLKPKAQRIALQGLAGRKGAVVALDIKTGAVRVMASDPGFNPNNLDRNGRFKQLQSESSGSPLFNRATQAGYPPGSTFKVITAAAALDSGRYTPDSVVNGNNGKSISGVPLNNFGGKSWGDITLTTALTNSVNTVWAEVGNKVGRDKMAQYMKRFGFYAQPDLDYPTDQLNASGLRRKGRLLPVSSKFVDVGRMSIGQEKLQVTPLQMAEVAATIANGGIRMRPHIVEKVIDADGRTVERVKPSKSERVMKPETAAKLTTMMKNVVREGSGTAAALSGVEVAGKTGTAEVDRSKGLNDAWFIGFTNKVAVAVVVERVQGQGGVIAAPIARNVLQALGG